MGTIKFHGEEIVAPDGLSDRELWEKRYSLPGRKRKLPDDFLCQYAAKLTPGRILDVACGEGRNAIFISKLGPQYHVLGIDRSAAGIAKCRLWAEQEHLQCDFLEWDLETCQLPEQSFASIVVTRYMQRSLFAVLERALEPGGTLLYETLTSDSLCFNGAGLKHGPRQSHHLLEPGELRQAFPSLEVLYYDEALRQQSQECTACLWAVKPKTCA